MEAACNDGVDMLPGFHLLCSCDQILVFPVFWNGAEAEEVQ